MALFGSQNPQKEANKYLQQIPGVSRETYDPYIQRGQAAGDVLGQQFGQMAQDPTAMLESLMAGYAPSQGYQLKQKEMLKGAAGAAAAGGMRGSQADQQRTMGLSQSLLDQDMQDWLKNVMGLQSQGLAGEQGLYGTGFQGSQALGSDLTNVLGQQGGMAFQGAQDRNKMLQDILGGAAGAGTQLAKTYMMMP